MIFVEDYLIKKTNKLFTSVSSMAGNFPIPPSGVK